jgi:hypothetical protein
MSYKRVLGVLAVALVAAGLVTNAHASTSTPAPVAVAEYDLGDRAFTDRPDWEGFSELRAVVHYPRKLPDGALPLVVLLHGQQVPCYTADDTGWDWPCPKGVRPYPSYRGYDYLGDALARDGFVVLSLSANGVNNFMGVAPQRARLISRHLELWQRLLTRGDGPLAGRFAALRGHVDLSRVGLLGHSVGGEGVMVEAADSNRTSLPAGVRIRGAVTLASPGSSGFYDTVVTRMPFAVISPSCWGHGNDRDYFDAAKGKTKSPTFLVHVARANHNYFNTVWTSGPGPTDGDDTECADTPNRPSAGQQQSFAVSYLRAFYALSLKDDRTGLPTLTGERPIPGVETTVEKLP